MRRLLSLLCLAFALAALSNTPAAAPMTLIERSAGLLFAYDPDGYLVFQRTPPEEFAFWLEADAALYATPAAVHESVHGLGGFGQGAWTYRIHLPDGSDREVPALDLFERREIVKRMDPDERDRFSQTYLTDFSGEQGLINTLDELNAYTWGLRTWTRLAPKLPGHSRYSARDGLATMMRYLLLTLEHARLEHPGAYDELRNTPEVLTLIADLWHNAEAALTDSLRFEDLGLADGYKLHRVYAETSELTRLYRDLPESAPTIDPDLSARYAPERRFDADELPAALEGRAKTTTRTRTRTVTRVSIDGVIWSCEALAEAEDGFGEGLKQQIRGLRARGEWPCP